MAGIFQNIGISEQLFFSFALGTTVSPALEPFVQFLVNEAWSKNAVLPPNAYVLALGVAQGQVPLKTAQGWANQQGISNDAFGALVDAANVGMPLGQAYQSWRRGDLTDAQFQTQLNRLGIEPAWFGPLEKLKTDRLDLGAIATAVHRGIMDDAGLLVTPVPTGTGHIPRIPVSSLDTIKEFAAQGIDPERARVLVADTGLPLSLGEMLQLYNRNVVTATDVKVSVAESNVRNEYMDAALALARRLLTPHEAAEAELRGVMGHQEAEDYAGLSGINPTDYATLFAILGRPLNVHQIVTGLARGGNYGGDYSDVPAGPYRDAIRRSAIRPEYASLAYANRYTYPSAFVLRSLAQSGDLGGQKAVQQVLEEIGWKPSFAQQVSTAWTTGGTSASHVAKAQTQLWTTTHRAYLNSKATDAEATTALTAAGVAAAEIPDVLALWQEERKIDRKTLSAAQTKKAWVEQVVNPTTGVAWTRDEALAALIDLGYSPADAATFLEL